MLTPTAKYIAARKTSTVIDKRTPPNPVPQIVFIENFQTL